MPAFSLAPRFECIGDVSLGDARVSPPDSRRLRAVKHAGVDTERDEIAAAAAGDRAAFRRLYDRHVPHVHGVLRRLAGNDPTRAEDWTQEAFVQAWQKLTSFRGDSAFSTWLHRLAVNVALMSLRAQRGSAIATAAGNDVLDSIAMESVDPGLRMDLAAAVAALPPRARTVLILHDVEGWKHAEIATELAIAAGTSKAQLHRARNLLRNFFEGTTQ